MSKNSNINRYFISKEGKDGSMFRLPDMMSKRTYYEETIIDTKYKSLPKVGDLLEFDKTREEWYIVEL